MKKILLTAILAVCGTVGLNAVPAYPGKQTVRQPDGSTITGRVPVLLNGVRAELIIEENDREQRGIKQLLNRVFKGKNNEKDQRNEKTV